jgi:hypothetical protein
MQKAHQVDINHKDIHEIMWEIRCNNFLVVMILSIILSCTSVDRQGGLIHICDVKVLEHSTYPPFYSGFVETWVKLKVLRNNKTEEYYIPYHGIDKLPKIFGIYCFEYRQYPIEYWNENESEKIQCAKVVVSFKLRGAHR